MTKFYQESSTRRRELLLNQGLLDQTAVDYLAQHPGLSDNVAQHLVENQIGQVALPLGVVPDFLINQQTITVPMAIEEPSVIAAASHGAKITRQNGGIKATMAQHLVIGQVTFEIKNDPEQAGNILRQHETEIKQIAQQAHPSLHQHGGGLRQIHYLVQKNFVTVELLIDPSEAMGANVVNTICEAVGQSCAHWLHQKPLLQILSNSGKNSLVSANVSLDPETLTTKTLAGREIADRIVSASEFALVNAERAVTHNKGVMNGVDAVILATGNDWRATEAAVHAYTSLTGNYLPLSRWQIQDGRLVGKLTLPLQIGAIGGAITVLPTAQIALQILQRPTVKQLGEIIASVGLAQNLAALLALVTTGIQAGHMRLQANSLALAVGATASEVTLVAAKIWQQGDLSQAAARQILTQLRQQKKELHDDSNRN